MRATFSAPFVRSFTTRGLFNKLRYIFLQLARTQVEKDGRLGTRNERLKLYPTFMERRLLLYYLYFKTTSCTIIRKIPEKLTV